MSLRNFKRDVALLTIGSAFEKTQAARTLACHGAADCDAADAIVAAGAIDPLVALVTNGAAGGQKQAVRALQNLARNDANVAAIVAAGAVEPLVALARDAESSESLKDAAELALEALKIVPDASEVMAVKSPPRRERVAQAPARSRDCRGPGFGLGGAAPPKARARLVL